MYDLTVIAAPTIEDAMRQVRCPRCRARVGERCATANGGTAAKGHAARFKAAKRARIILPGERREGSCI